MSADNWTDCPICKTDKDKEIKLNKQKNEEKLNERYGKITIDEFDKLRLSLKKQEIEFSEDLDSENNLREDYEVGVGDNGLAYVIYSAKCQDCDSLWKFKKEDIKRIQ